MDSHRNSTTAPTGADSTPHAQAPNHLPFLMTADEVAALLRMHRKTVYAALKSTGTKRLPGRKVKGSWRIARADLLDWLKGDTGR